MPRPKMTKTKKPIAKPAPKPAPKKEKEPDFSPPFTGKPEEEVNPETIKEPEKPSASVTNAKPPKISTWNNNESQCVPKTSATCQNCFHGPETHYGSDTDWCNLNKCRCQGWVN